MATTTNGEANKQADAIMQDSANGRVAVHSFDPEASPEQKGAAAGKARDQLKSVNNDSGPGARELTVETGKSDVVPTITVEDMDGEKSPEPSHEHEDTPQPPGALGPAASAIPDWYRVGWRQASRIDAAPHAEGEEQDQGVLHMFLGEQFYGAWYHNAALIVFAVFASHFLTRFNFGWGWLFIILAVCNTYYSTSMERVRRRARDDIQRELVKNRLLSEHESADWINNFLDRFWLIYEPVLSATIISSVDQILSTNTPAFLDSLRLTQFTLGTKAPRIDKVRTFPKTPDDVVMMDWGISFTPNDVSDLTPRQAANKVNPKIVLSVRVGKGLATASMPILLEDITFSGLMRIRMKLMSNFPHVQIVDICFLEKPVIDYVLKPVGGETFGFDIGHIPGLSTFIRDMTHATLAPIMYDPNVFTLNLEQLLSGAPLDTAIGVIQVAVESARGITGTKVGGGTPDPYISLSLNNREELAVTKYKNNTYNPTWMETKFILVNSLTESLVLSLYDYNEHRKNALLSSTSFELAPLADDATREGIEAPLLKDGKERGTLRYGISYYPVIKPEEGKDIPNTSVGIVRVTLHQAKELDQSKSLSGDLNPLARLYLGDGKTEVFSTRLFKHTNAPVWEQAYEFLCADKAASVILVKVIDDREFLKDPVVGYMSIKLEDLLESKTEAGRDWFPLSNCKSGKIRLSAEWKPLNMAGSLHGADQYKPPIGVVRLHLDKAVDVKNVEATLGGKSDPYVRVQVNNVTKGRTEVMNNNLNPVWDEIIYIPVHSLRETMLLECMDYQHMTRDRSLGSVELRILDLARESTDRLYPFESTGKKTASDPIRLDKGNVYKGQLHYTAQFIPALALEGVKFDAPANEIQRATEEVEDPDGKEVRHKHSKSLLGDITPPSPTINEQADSKAPASPATTKTPKIADATAPEVKEEPEEPAGVKMGVDELLTHQSGVIVFNVVSGNLAKKARLEVLLDDGYWPCFSTVKARSNNAKWETVGEGFVKELDFGRVWLRLNETDDGEKENIIGEWKGDAKAFLQSTLAGAQQFTLQDEERPSSTVMIESRFVPVPVTLEPRESINNQGTLRVDLLDGSDIRGVDRSGKSDPFASFTLNGQKVHKSQTKKKTLSPVWNENFTVQVPSRVAADFSVEIFDWNQIGTAETLGVAHIKLDDFEPFESIERTLDLVSAKGQYGHIRVRLMFQPEIIAKSRKATSTFSTAGRAMTQFGGLPVTAGKGVLHGVTGGLHGVTGGLHGVTGVFKKPKEEEAHNQALPVPDVPSGQASHPVGQSDVLHADAASFSHETATSEPGTLRVTILDAKDLSSSESKPYATIRLGDKEYKTKPMHKTAAPEWNETFNFSAGTFTPKLYIWIHDHKTLGKDKLLGEGEIDIWRHIQPEGVSAAEVSAELQGNGLVRVRLEFDANAHPANGAGSRASTPRAETGRTMSISSPSRFSLRGRRPGTADSDD
ncbi:C2 domain-containing protein [Mycena maculata]|uniref:C2 domain-containing protein n=1 Tax=Mycena maculata TaxID=230809 RepID=A0AAD7JUK9_9AGAR|nr:C2 domain-containing protein [Mycena maculata]